MVYFRDFYRCYFIQFNIRNFQNVIIFVYWLNLAWLFFSCMAEIENSPLEGFEWKSFSSSCNGEKLRKLKIRFQLALMYEEFEDTKGVIKIRLSKKNRQYNGQQKKYKRTNNDLQNHTHNTKDRVTRTPLKTGGELGSSGRISSSCSTSGTRRVNLVINPVISHEWGKDREVLTTSGTYPCIEWHKILVSISLINQESISIQSQINLYFIDKLTVHKKMSTLNHWLSASLIFKKMKW